MRQLVLIGMLCVSCGYSRSAEDVDVRAWGGMRDVLREEHTEGRVVFHVLNASCPIADPSGPEPWRASRESARVTLVGFLADGAAGTITHHGQSSHTHPVLPEESLSGHLDCVSLRAGARLSLSLYPD